MTRRLRRLGASRSGQYKRHERWILEREGRLFRTVIPRHPGQEIPEGTLSRILRDLGLRKEEL